MYVVVVLWSYMIACGARQSYDNYRITGLLPTSQVKYCKCIEEYFKWLKTLRPEKNDVRILYEPLEYVIFQKFPLAYTPFIYSADAIKRDSSIREIAIPNWIYQTNLFEELPGASVKIKRRHSFPPQVNADNEDYEPLFLDINVQSKNNYEVLDLKYLLQNKMDEWAEKKLKNCLDIYGILDYKKQKTEIQKKNSVNTKLKMYSHLSNADIIAKINNNKCNVVADAITKIVNDANNKGVNLKKHDTDGPYTYYKSEIAEVDKSQETNIFWQAQGENNLNRIVPPTDITYLETSTLIDNEVLVPDNFRTNVFSRDDYIGNASVLSTPFTTEVEIYDTTSETNQHSNSIIRKNETLLHEDISSMSVDFPISIDSENYIDLTKSTSDTSNRTQDEINTAVTEQFDVPEGPGSNHRNYNDYIRKSAYHKEYFEGEYDIPKLVTVELPNNTIISEIRGIEKIPNDDFVTSKDIVAEEKSNCTIPTTNNPNKSSMEEKNNVLVIKSGKEKNIGETISGKLYLKYGTEFIPASFLQQPEGNLDMAIDLPSLCKSNKQEMMSQIVETICNCIEVGS